MKIPLVDHKDQMKKYEDEERFAETLDAFEKMKLQDGKIIKDSIIDAITSLKAERYSPIIQQESCDHTLQEAIESKLLPSDLLSSEDE